MPRSLVKVIWSEGEKIANAVYRIYNISKTGENIR